MSTTNPQKGFTLVETLIAILILVTALTGPLTMASRSLLAGTVAKDEVAAYYLAQDAIEYIRAVRDNNSLQSSPTPWLTGLSLCVSADGSAKCHIDTVQASTPTACTSGVCSVLNYNSNTNYYTYSTGAGIAPSIFRRTISITNPFIGTADEAQIVVTVSWSDRAAITRTIAVQENIFNWQ